MAAVEEEEIMNNPQPKDEKQQEEEVVVVVEKVNEENDGGDEPASKKRKFDEEEDDGFANLGKLVLEWTAPVVHTLGSLWNSFLGTAAPPAEPEEGPPAIDAVISLMVLGNVRSLLQGAWLDAVTYSAESSSSNRTVEEYKKDFAFETRVGETTTIHSVRLQLYDCSKVDRTTADVEHSAAWNVAVASGVQTIVLALTQPEEELVAALGTWTTWIRQQFQHVANQPEIVLLLRPAAAEDSSSDGLSEDTALDQACQSHGIESWHVLSPSNNNRPNAVTSIDDFLHSWVRSQHLKPLAKEEDDDDAKKPSPKRRRVELTSTEEE